MLQLDAFNRFFLFGTNVLSMHKTKVAKFFHLELSALQG